MFTMYGARESIDKEKFIYDNVSGRTLVLVPNQYTLVAEQQALRYLRRTCLFNIEILSMNRLGLRLLQERGEENMPVLDKYGRFMLLSRIISDHKDDLEVFHEAAGKSSFTSMVNDLISDMKQQDCSLEDLQNMEGAGSASPLLRGKLKELSAIIREYEAAIDGKYTDTEDYIGAYVEAMKSSEYIRDKFIWIYGFDSVTPKFMDAILELAKYSRGAAFILNESDFGLDQIVRGRFTAEAANHGVEIQYKPIGQEYSFGRQGALAAAERYLFSRNRSDAIYEKEGSAPSASAAGKDTSSDQIRLVEASNPYYEAETAAAYICGLLRDGYRMRDIVVISNDETKMQNIVKRTFGEYGLPLFADSRRGITGSRVVMFIASLMRAEAFDCRTPVMLAMIKTGLAGMEDGEAEDLEKYARKYSIKGSMWRKPFRYGAYEYGEKGFANIERIRTELMEKFSGMDQLTASAENTGDFVRKFISYLDETWRLSDRVDDLCRSLENKGMNEESEQTRQSLEASVRIMGQVVEILGDEPFDMEKFIEIFETGLSSVDIGVIPPALDGITMGTMIRTRTGPAKAVIVLGANEGVLPMEPSPEGLFSVDEKAFFSEHDLAIGRLDDIKMIEENSAMYRMVSKPSEKLYVSWSLSDATGDDLKPSSLVEGLRGLFPDIPVEKDIISGGFDLTEIQSPDEALRHSVNYLKSRPDGAGRAERAARDSAVSGVLDWYEKNEPDRLDRMMNCAVEENIAPDIGADLSKALYSRGGSITVSASSMERYFRCPFRHFVMYGLRPEKDRDFRSGPPEIGDIYHDALMRVARKITDSGGQIRQDLLDSASAEAGLHTEAESGTDAQKTAGQNSSEEAGGDGRLEERIADLVDQELSDISSEYHGGLFVSTGREKYRTDRIRKTCQEAVIAMARQLLSGSVETAWFEERFGRTGRFRPVEVEAGDQKVYVEGKIDRVDIGPDGRARVIDYKTGSDKLDIDLMKCGYKMQLMVYMEGVHASSHQPAGIFYFKISDDEISASRLNQKGLEKKQEDRNRRFDLQGAYVADDTENETEDNGKKKKPQAPEGVSSSSTALSADQFGELEEDVRLAINSICTGIVNGKITIYPTRRKSKKAETECRYCDYRAVCKFDRSYDGNDYHIV